jgi:hypothetical protein
LIYRRLVGRPEWSAVILPGFIPSCLRNHCKPAYAGQDSASTAAINRLRRRNDQLSSRGLFPYAATRTSLVREGYDQPASKRTVGKAKEMRRPDDSTWVSARTRKDRTRWIEFPRCRDKLVPSVHDLTNANYFPGTLKLRTRTGRRWGQLRWLQATLHAFQPVLWGIYPTCGLGTRES